MDTSCTKNWWNEEVNSVDIIEVLSLVLTSGLIDFDHYCVPSRCARSEYNSDLAAGAFRQRSWIFFVAAVVVNTAQGYARSVVVWSGPVVCVFSHSRSVTHIRVPYLAYSNPRVMREADAAEQGRRNPVS